MKKVVVLAFNNCLTSSVVGLLDIFQIANQFLKMSTGADEDIFDVNLATVDGQSTTSFNGFPIPASISVAEIGAVDYLIVPPLMNNIDEILEENKTILNVLRDGHKNGVTIASVCTGVFFLAEAGLLNKIRVTTNPLMLSMFQQHYPDVKVDTTRVLIDAKDIITVGPTYAFLDLVIFLIEKHGGSALALQCSKLLLHDKNRTSQMPYHISPLESTHNDLEIQAVQQWIRKNVTTSQSIEEIAGNFHMSARNFVRRFRAATGETPIAYIQRLRVEQAKRHLEESRQSIDQITSEVGYTDVKSFGRLFKRYTSLSPSEYRKRFATRDFSAA